MTNCNCDISSDISVVIPFHDRNEYLDAALQTVDNQTLRPCRIVVVDDGSLPELTCPKREDLTLLRLAENRGPARARNLAVEETSTKYVAFLDSDDGWHPDKLARQYALLSSAPEDVFGVFCAYGRSGRKLRAGVVVTPQVTNWFRYFLMGIRCAPGTTLMFRREAFMEIGGFNPAFRRYEDWDLLLRASLSRWKRFLTIDTPLAEVNLTGRPDPAVTTRALDAMEKAYFPRLSSRSERRLFKAALNIERAAVQRWAGSHARMLPYLFGALASPSVVKREILLTLGLY